MSSQLTNAGRHELCTFCFSACFAAAAMAAACAALIATSSSNVMVCVRTARGLGFHRPPTHCCCLTCKMRIMN